MVPIYIDGKGYILENHGQEIVKTVDSLKDIQKMISQSSTKKIEEAIGSNYDTVMEYLDSKRDRDRLKGILTKVRSVNFMTRLANVQNKRSFGSQLGTFQGHEKQSDVRF